MVEIKTIKKPKATLNSLNPILADNQIGFETDTKHWKIGNGVTPYNDLPYNCGESAYDIWVRHGGQGTEEDFLASLKGEPGKSTYDEAVEGGYYEGTEEQFFSQILQEWKVIGEE
jgi:hypothetical protein